MAITITSTPQILSPAYNPVEFTFTSTNSTKAGFKYLIDIYSGNTTSSLLARQRVPALLDGSGRVDISRILNNFVDVDAPLSAITTPYNTRLSKFDYSIRVGEEYLSDSLPFLQMFSLSGAQYSNQYTVLSGTSAHGYFTGDTVFVTSAYEAFNGYYNVTRVLNTFAFAVEKQANFFIGVGSTGTTTLVPAVKLQFSGLSTSSGFTIFNGVKTFADFINWNGTNATLSGASTTKIALTDQPPSNFYATPSQDMLMNFYVSGTSANTYVVKGVTNNGITGTTSSITGNGTKQVIQINVGFNSVFAVNNLATYYDVALYQNSTTQFTKTYRIYIDRRCIIEPFEILFMDRMGSLSSFAFQLRSTETGSVNRTAFKQQINTPYNRYNSYDRGDTNIHIDMDREYSLTTNFMSEEMSVYFEQLITSPYTWVKINNIYYACMIVDNSFEVVHQKNRRLISKTVKIKLSNSNNINI